MSAFFAIPSAGATFFFSAWIMMIFWGIVAERAGIGTLSYVDSMIATIGLWLAVAPLIAAVARRSRSMFLWRHR